MRDYAEISPLSRGCALWQEELRSARGMVVSRANFQAFRNGTPPNPISSMFTREPPVGKRAAASEASPSKVQRHNEGSDSDASDADDVVWTPSRRQPQSEAAPMPENSSEDEEPIFPSRQHVCQTEAGSPANPMVL